MRIPFLPGAGGDPVARGGLARLGLAFALAWVAVAMTAAPGSVAWVALSKNPGDAGAFFAAFSAGAAVGALVGGRAMDRFGRRIVLVAAYVAAALGYATAGAGYAFGSLAIFSAGAVLLAAGTGAVYLTRLAAADLLPVNERGRGVAFVQVCATFGAVLGPTLLSLSGPLGTWLGADPRSFVWFIAPPLLLLAAFVIFRGPEPLAIARARAAATPAASAVAASAPASGAARVVVLAAAFATLAAAQAAMVGVMGVTGAALEHAGHGVEAMGFTMALHFIGMFGLSLVVGRLADRAGRRPTLLAGQVILAAGALGVAYVPGLAGHAIGLLVVGLGWSFAYIASTVLVADLVPLERRARVMGAADLATSLFVVLVVMGSGIVYGQRGLEGVGLVAAALALLPAVLVLASKEPARAPAPLAAAAPPAK
ncbi:MAG TPA: MFS transporter [Candidatus Thermoplasmatota archaeon]|nr:MFS transporter [Candidatus Thermoplasmatota archaeon]